MDAKQFLREYRGKGTVSVPPAEIVPLINLLRDLRGRWETIGFAFAVSGAVFGSILLGKVKPNSLWWTIPTFVLSVFFIQMIRCRKVNIALSDLWEYAQSHAEVTITYPRDE